MSNLSNTTAVTPVQNTTTAQSDTAYVTSILNYVDNTIRITVFVIHILYIVIVLTHKELRTRSLMLLHNTNFIGLISAINFIAWMNTTIPPISDPYWYSVVCTISETAWVVIKYARAYSILILGLYRFMAVYFIVLYRRLSQSIPFVIFGCLLSWLCGGIVHIIAKFSARTRFGPVLCSDGYTTVFNDTILYVFLCFAIGYMLPIIGVVVLFFFVNRKLNQLSERLGKKKAISHAPIRPATKEQSTNKLTKASKSNIERDDTNSHSHSNSRGPVSTNAEVNRKEAKLERTLSFQFVIVNIFEFISAIALTSINLYLFFPEFNTRYYFMRQILRSISNICQGLIPVICLILHPFKFRILFIQRS